MQLLADRIIETQLLVVGGSGAGVTAAIQAHRQKKQVLLVCKGKVGRSGNAIMAGGGFGIDGYSARHIVGEERAAEGYTQAQYFDNIVKEGFFLSEQDVLEQFVQESPAAVKELLDWGKAQNLYFDFRPPANWSSAGLSWGKCIKQGLKQNSGIALLEDTAVVELLTNRGRVCGALAIELYSGQLVLIRAQAVVLATGGYQPFSFKNTVTDMTGDGPAMGFRAGAKLADMEFLLAFPTALSPRALRGSIYPFVFEMAMRRISHRVLDKDGAEISIPPEIYGLCHRTKLSKLCSDYYWGHAIAQGRGSRDGGVYMDFSQNDAVLRAQDVADFEADNQRYYPPGCYKGDNIRAILDCVRQGEPFEVGLGYEYSMGGLLVDAKMCTTVPGLFAAGEAASGVFGACRAGDGLTEMLGQGRRAGQSAAEYCADAQLSGVDEEQAQALCSQILAPLQRPAGQSPLALQARLERAADEGFGVIRTQAGLERALDRVRECAGQMDGLKVGSPSRRYNYEWLTACTVRNTAVCTEAGIRAALLRKESRGCHIRQDYPQVDHDNWCVRLIDENCGGGHKLSRKAPKVTRIALPTGREENVMAYFLSAQTDYQGQKGGAVKK